MFCNKDRTAVFKWLNGCLKCSDLLCNIYDFLFIHTDTWSEYWHITYFICDCKVMDRLACYLSDTFTSDQCKASTFICKMFCDLHHITAHDDRKLLMRALFINIQLDICKVDHMQFDWSGIFCNDLRKIYNLLFCSLACVWWCMEICCIDVYSTFCDHISCNWTVDSSG